MTSFRHVGVVGAGQMGRGITEVCARAGLSVTLCDVTEDRARAVFQVLVEKAARRSLSVKLFQAGEPQTVGRGRGRIEVSLNAGISDDLARSLQKKARQVSPKVQVRVQGDQLRVTSREKDALQAVIKALREDDSIPVPLQFINYR